MAFSVDFSELLKLANDMAADVALMNGAVEQAVGRATDQLHSWAVADAPQRTGELRGSIRKDTSGLGRRVHSQVKQGFFQEYGTSKMAPQPWLMVHSDRAHALLEQYIFQAKWGLSA